LVILDRSSSSNLSCNVFTVTEVQSSEISISSSKSSSKREVNPSLIEAALSMGASPFQIIMKVYIRESVPSLISNITIALTTILGYTAMSGSIGGGGLGKIAISYGYYRYITLVMILAVIVLVLLVQGIQSLGTFLATKLDRRLRNN
jgi:D-methionine transport system permease protein